MKHQRDRADADLVHRTAAWLRADPDGARHAGMADGADTRALAALLDLVAAELAHLHPAVRSQTVESCRVALGTLDHPDRRIPLRRPRCRPAARPRSGRPG